ncbi:MAG TPA: pyrroloquinoline quinone-dependent dehydrogenase [Bryobacteraceae bacterium]|jgi:quinoprotein glucose dehydrogenase
MKLLTLAVYLPLLLNAQSSVQTVQRMCTGCHTIDVVTGSRQSRQGWQNVVQDMVARGAVGSASDIETVVDYLARNYGEAGTNAPVAVAPATSDAPAAAKHLDLKLSIPRAEQWPAYGHDPGGQRYSPLKQITPENVGQLQRAWTFHMGKVGSEATPLVIDSVMYLTAPDAIFALEPETGRVIWKYASAGVARRGLAYSEGRIFCGVETGKMVALDAKTGKPISDFGDNGLIDLRRGVADGLPDAKFFLASPPAIYKNVVITGGNNGELAPSQGAYGDVRGWDAHTGKLLWTFHTVPRPGEPGNETWAEGSWKQRSGTNVWGIMTVDAARGLVYLPIGCPTSDMYGADRHGNGLYGNSLVALDASTGKVKWFRQLVHHDLWDYDPAAPPALIDVVRDGKTIPAVAQITKMSLLFVFDRTTGEPIFGLEERPVPASKVPGEETSPTQPFPVKPPPLARMNFQESDLYDLTPEHAQFCRDLLVKNHMFTQGPYTPMPLEGNALTFPSTLGGGNWGGLSYDPALGYVFTNVMNVGQWGHMEQKQGTYVRMAGSSGAYGRFWNPQNHIPCTKPPFGEMVAVNINTGDVAWRVPLGHIPELEAKGVKNTGTQSIGGSITTAAGLLFIAATNDSHIRAFDSRTGKELWTAALDTSAYATPVTYRGRDGRQYLAVVAGGAGFFGTTPGDSVIAFALP